MGACATATTIAEIDAPHLETPVFSDAVKSRRSLVLLVVALGLAGAPFAFAQPKKPARKPPTAAASQDAGRTDDNLLEAANAGTDAEAPKAEPRPAAQANDGGVRPSPLTPEPPEFASADGGAQVDYDRVLADVAALRARVAAVGDSLYRSRISVRLRSDGKTRFAKMFVSVDEGVVYTAKPGFSADDYTPIYERALAPGRHALTVEFERSAAENDAFRTTQTSRFVVDVPKDSRLDVELRLEDDSTMGADFPGDQSGRYDVRVRMKATARPAGK